VNGFYNIFFSTLFLATVPLTATFAPNNHIIESNRIITVSQEYVNAGYGEAEIPQEGRYDVMIDSVAGPLTYYNQGDSRWENYLWGGKDPLSIYGCGPTIMAMLITSLTGNQVMPVDAANWAASNKCWAPGDGSYHCLIQHASSAFGIEAVPIRDYSVNGIQQALNSGRLVVALVGKGHFTQRGHFLIITRMTEEGKVRIADPNSFENTSMDWDPGIILKELNHRASNGGPLWAIDLPDPSQ
jgi:hypothetical protein